MYLPAAPEVTLSDELGFFVKLVRPSIARLIYVWSRSEEFLPSTPARALVYSKDVPAFVLYSL